MAAVTRVCRVCGKKYEVCPTARRVDGVFRWQEVSCSPECGEAYLAAVIAERTKSKAPALSADSDESESELNKADITA